jgi:hypothetical protein
MNAIFNFDCTASVLKKKACTAETNTEAVEEHQVVP